MNKFEKIKFVSIGGSNDTGDGSFELPYRTIQYAMSDIPIDELGWRVVLMSGSYDEPNLDLLQNIPLQAMIPNTVTITSPIIFAYNGSYSFDGINFSIIDNYAFTCTNNLNLQLTFTSCGLTATPTVDSGTGIFNIDNVTFNISIVDSLLSIQNYQELVSIINTTTNSSGVISLNNCEIKAIKNNQIQLDAPILFLNGNTKAIVENSKIYGQIQIENNASINANKTNLKTSQSPVIVTNSSTTSRLTHCDIDCETNPVIDGLGTLQVAECCFLNNGTRFSTTLNNNTGIYYLPTTSPRLVDQALPQSIQSGALYYAQGDFYDDRTSRFRIPQANQETGILTPDQLPDAQYGEKGVNFLISVRKGATKQSVIDMEAGSNMEIDTTEGIATFNATGSLTNKVLVELADGTTEAVSKLKQGSNMDWEIDGETVTQSATGGSGKSYEIGDGLQTTLNPDTGKEILSTKADDTQFTYNEDGATILTEAVTDQYDNGDGINISDIDPETGKRTISTKVNASEFRYNDNGVMELSDQVDNALAKSSTSVQTVNQIPADAEGNVDVAGSLPVLTLVSDFVGEISVLKDWLLTQPDQQSILYIKTQKLPDIQVRVFENYARQSWQLLCDYIRSDIEANYYGVPKFTMYYNNGRLELSTNDILNPIEYYIPEGPLPEINTLNGRMKLLPPGAEIVSQPYATIDQVNTIVNNAVIPLQQDIKLLNLDMFFADYYIGISINYLLSGVWDGDDTQTYNEILASLSDTNTLKFTLANDVRQYSYPLTITKQQFIDFATLDNFSDYISDQMVSQYDLTGFKVIFKELGTQGFLITNLNSNAGVLVCEEDDNNLAVIMKLTAPSAKNRIYTEFSENSLQQQIIDNQLIINDVFINKIQNGEHVTIDVDPTTNTATFSATGGGSGGANKVTVSVNGANPVVYDVDGTGNIAINVPLTDSLTSNLLLVTTNSGKTNLQADVNNQLTINNTSKQLALSAPVTASLAKADTALQDITTTNLIKGTKVNNILPLSAPIASDTQLGLAQADGSTITATNGIFSASQHPIEESGVQYWNFTGTTQLSFNPEIIPTVTDVVIKRSYPSKKMNIAFPVISNYISSASPYQNSRVLYGLSNIAKEVSVNELSYCIAGNANAIGSIQTAQSENPIINIWIKIGSTTPTQVACTISDTDCISYYTLAAAITNQMIAAGYKTFSCIFNTSENKYMYSILDKNITLPKVGNSDIPLNNATGISRVGSESTIYNLDVEYGVDGTDNIINGEIWHKVYNTTDQSFIMAYEDDYVKFNIDVRNIIQGGLFSQYTQNNLVALSITSTAYTSGAIESYLPIRQSANYVYNGNLKSYFCNSNQLFNLGILTASPTSYGKYTYKEVNNGNGIVLMQIVLSKYRRSSTSWNAVYQALYLDDIKPVKAYQLKIIIDGRNSPYTINTGNYYEITLNVQPSEAVANPNNPVLNKYSITHNVELQARNGNIVVIINGTPVGISSATQQQIGFGGGSSNLSLSKENSGIADTELIRTTYVGQVFIEPIPINQDSPYSMTTCLVKAGYVYNVQISSSIKFDAPLLNNTYVNVGIMNINDFTGDYFAVPVNVSLDPNFDYKIPIEFGVTDIEGLPKEDTILTIDTRGYTEDQYYRMVVYVDQPENVATSAKFQNNFNLLIQRDA